MKVMNVCYLLGRTNPTDSSCSAIYLPTDGTQPCKNKEQRGTKMSCYENRWVVCCKCELILFFIQVRDDLVMRNMVLQSTK